MNVLASLVKVVGGLAHNLVSAQKLGVVGLLPLHQRVLDLLLQHLLQLLQNGGRALGLGQQCAPSVVQCALLCE